MAEKPIVVGIDGSAAGKAALMWAADEAVRRQAPLRLAHCVSDPDRRTAARAALDQWSSELHRMRPTLDLSAEVLDHPPARDLLHASRDAAMLVVGTHTAAAEPALLFGSTAADVAAHSRCPTVIVRDTPQTSGPFAGQIVAAVDGSPRSDAVLNFAFAEARWRQLPVAVVHVDERASARRYAASTRSTAMVTVRALGQEQLASLVRPFTMPYPEVRWTTSILDDKPGSALLKASAGAALMVIGDTGRTAVSGALLGSVTMVVMQRSSCSVAVVHG